MAPVRLIVCWFFCHLWGLFTLPMVELGEIFLTHSSRFYLHADVNSYFGFSISSFVGQNKAFCLVGAPRNILDTEVKENVRNTGAVFRISFENDDCSLVPLDDLSASKDLIGDSNWLGGSVSSAMNGIDGVQLGCDPRFLSKTSYGVNKSDHQLLSIGRCSIYTGASLNYLSIHPCSSIDEGACLSGFSSSVSVDDYGSIKVALGLPGSFLTEGNVFLGTYSGKKVVDKILLKSSPSDLKNRGYNLGYAVQLAKLWYKKNNQSPFTNFASNDVVVASSTLWQSNGYRGVVMVLDSKLDINQIVYIHDTGHIGSNFGASITTGDFNGDGILDIVVGAPFYTDYITSSQRIVDIGTVYIFYGVVSTNHKYLVSKDRDMLKGNQPKGYFGTSLITLGDIDGDGKDDFAVGCPGCGHDSLGSVFIYLGGSKNPVQIIQPADLNHLPSTPLCGSFDDHPIKRPFKHFGWSLASQFDAGGNSVPHIIIGDYSTSQVVRLRAVNVLWLDSATWVIPKASPLHWNNRSNPNQPCINDVCHYYVSFHAKIFGRVFLSRDALLLRVKIDLDSEVIPEKSKRMTFVSNKKSVDFRNVSFNFRRSGSIIEIFSSMIEPRFESIRFAIWKPIVINVSVSYVSESDAYDQRVTSTPWIFHPFLGKTNFLSQKRMFKNPDCGDDNKCVTDVRVFITDWSAGSTEKTDLYYQEKFQERKLVVAIGNWGENAFNVKMKITIPSVLEFRGLDGQNCTIRVGDDADYVVAVCHFEDPFVNSNNGLHKLYLTLSTGGAFQRYENMKTKTIREMQLRITVEGSSDNDDIDVTNNFGFVDYFLRLSANIKIAPMNIEKISIDDRNFSSKIVPFQKVYPETLGPSIKAVFTVTNSGPSPIEYTYIKITIPFRTENREHIVYFLRHIHQRDEFGNPTTTSLLPEVISIKGPAQGECRIPDSFIDSFHLNAIERNKLSKERGKRRVKDELPIIEKSAAWRKLESVVKEIIHCNNSKSPFGKMECLEIQCKIFNLTLQSEVQIVIQARIWAETFFHNRISQVLMYINVTGNIGSESYGLPVSGDLTIEPTQTRHYIILKGIERLINVRIPIWPIVLGIVLGLSCLTIVAFILWRCGFFRRNRKPKENLLKGDTGNKKKDSPKNNNSVE